jgi:hypothetical protein
MEAGGDRMQSIGKEIRMEIVKKANALSLVASKSAFASYGFLPFCSTFDLIIGIKILKK